jgi:hypothetical protein
VYHTVNPVNMLSHKRRTAIPSNGHRQHLVDLHLCFAASKAAIGSEQAGLRTNIPPLTENSTPLNALTAAAGHKMLTQTAKELSRR